MARREDEEREEDEERVRRKGARKVKRSGKLRERE